MLFKLQTSSEDLSPRNGLFERFASTVEIPRSQQTHLKHEENNQNVLR